ncbi:dormancy-associated protein homolog 3-like isoform X1 [Musa acuminata AAA Group]|uniref:dormancy-associated protein homolog 3-like isoform X1 n=1 Tax=Musa acuminata AAA Group TaxID=214697 RepID=UPI0031D0E54C
MGLLDQLWDDTVAGPPPVGKLRKYNSFSPSSSAAASSAAAAAGGVAQVTRSVTILRTASSSAATSPRSPSSPASAPDSPLAPPGPWGDWKRLRRKPVPVAEGAGMAEPRTPTVYDWATGTQKTVFLRLRNCNYRKKHGLQGGDKFSRQMKVRWGRKLARKAKRRRRQSQTRSCRHLCLYLDLCI